MEIRQKEISSQVRSTQTYLKRNQYENGISITDFNHNTRPYA